MTSSAPPSTSPPSTRPGGRSSYCFAGSNSISTSAAFSATTTTQSVSQLFAAMIAYALLRIAARSHRIKISILRFTDLVALCLFERRHIGAIDKPPPPSARFHHKQLSNHSPA